MGAKVHLHMHVSDLGKSRDFYERFLGADPSRSRPAT
jgi:extradiol dioxygenase family protein